MRIADECQPVIESVQGNLLKIRVPCPNYKLQSSYNLVDWEDCAGCQPDGTRYNITIPAEGSTLHFRAVPCGPQPAVPPQTE